MRRYVMTSAGRVKAMGRTSSCASFCSVVMLASWSKPHASMTSSIFASRAASGTHCCCAAATPAVAPTAAAVPTVAGRASVGRSFPWLTHQKVASCLDKASTPVQRKQATTFPSTIGLAGCFSKTTFQLRQAAVSSANLQQPQDSERGELAAATVGGGSSSNRKPPSGPGRPRHGWEPAYICHGRTTYSRSKLDWCTSS